MMRTRPTVAILSIVCAAACASSSRSGVEGPLRWSGEFRTPAGYSSAVIESGGVSQAAGYGSLTLTPADTPDRTHVDLSVSVPAATGGQLAWAVLQGRCGSAPAPVTGLDEFPLIDIGSSGTATVRVVLPFGLDRLASYHANVYRSSRNTDEGEVLMCANLDRSGGG